jgi:hypothetical protein
MFCFRVLGKIVSLTVPQRQKSHGTIAVREDQLEVVLVRSTKGAPSLDGSYPTSNMLNAST